MEFEEAVKRMASKRQSRAVVDTIHDAVKPLCKTSTEANPDGLSLWDWLAWGKYTFFLTAERIAQEWDSQNSD